MKQSVQRILRSRRCAQPTAAGHQPPTALRVAAYCRVSTSMDSQQLSLETQISAFEAQIKARAGWELAGIYADDGISGGSAAKRPAFQRMLRDCEAGRIDYIITKSISRFARNTLECLSIIRRLQSMGVQLMFEKENIDTGTAFSEMLLTILAAFAQEESRALSENQKWSIRKRFEEGTPRWHAIYGYRKGPDGEYEIVEQQAKVVREAFTLYEHGMSFARIADAFNRAGHPTPGDVHAAGRDAQAQQRRRWDASCIYRMLCNEKYVGDFLMQKRYTSDHLTRKQTKNDQSVLPSYYVRDHHVAIVTRRQFERVQKIMRLKNSRIGPRQYPYDDKLICPLCGARMLQRKMEVLEGRNAWRCNQRGCRMYILKRKIVDEAVLAAYAAVDMQAVRERLARAPMPQREGAQMLLDAKRKRSALKKVEYYWIDDLVERITFCRAESLTVHWRCGVETTVSLPIRHHREDPLFAGEVFLKREAEGTLRGHRVHEQPQMGSSLDIVEVSRRPCR